MPFAQIWKFLRVLSLGARRGLPGLSPWAPVPQAGAPGARCIFSTASGERHPEHLKCHALRFTPIPPAYLQDRAEGPRACQLPGHCVGRRIELRAGRRWGGVVGGGGGLHVVTALKAPVLFPSLFLGMQGWQPT